METNRPRRRNEPVRKQRPARGTCSGCGSPTLAKCGPKRLHHWAHVSTAVCYRWCEPETEWHRAWKSLFPTEW
ncbi:competence protein CoiA family protein [Rhizobium binae]|uniref:competence protein CoiA family protein n=1 Tax=Rhizobium binae TaxID=1138190 RepID=UPI001FEE23E8|nr:competence protein CoiA family protein [Rhizobium binae]